jgi:hypothetical protein
MTDTHKQAEGQVIWSSLACPKNSSKSTLLLLLRSGQSRKVKVLDLVDRCEMSITIAGVQYLYLRLDYESWSNKTGYKLGKEKKTSKITITWTTIFPFYEVWCVFLLHALLILPIGSTPLEWWCFLYPVLVDRAHPLEVMMSSYLIDGNFG